MVVSEATTKDRRRSSVSPIRERVRGKPRQEWLVAVGQGHSPARTLKRESRGRRNSKSPRTKKFDSARLSFGGLEQDRKPNRSLSPPQASGDGAPPPRSSRLRKKRPSLSPSSAASPKRHTRSAIATSPMVAAGDNNNVIPAQAGDTTAELSGSSLGRGRRDGVGGSPYQRPPALEPTSSLPTSASNTVAGNGPRTDWLSAAVARRAAGHGSNRNGGHVGGSGGSGADATRTTSDRSGAENGGGEAPGLAAVEGDSGRDAKLSSLLLLSPGKEYWTGRLAAESRRDAESPRAAPGRCLSRLNNNDDDALGIDGTDLSSTPTSPAIVTEPNDDKSRGPSTGRRQPQQGDTAEAPPGGSPPGKEYLSFTVGKRGAPLSPSGSTASSSVWSTQAFTSPGCGGRGGGGMASLGGGNGRADLSPWRSSLPKGEAWSPPSPRSASSSLSPARGEQWLRGFSPGEAPRPGSTAAVAAFLRAARRDGGALPPSPSLGGDGGRGCDSASSARFSPGKGSLGVGVEGRSRSASPPRRKEALDSRVTSASGDSSVGTGKLVASGRFTSPSSLPVVEADTGDGDEGDCVVIEDADCPERTTAAPLSSCKSDSPERTGEDTANDDGCTDGGGGGGDATTGVAPSVLFKKEEAGRESAGEDVSGGAAWPEVEDFEETGEETLLSPVEAGTGGEDLLSPSARPSPLRPQLYSPFPHEPSPSTGQDHLESFAVAEEVATEQSSSSAAPPVAMLGAEAKAQAEAEVEDEASTESSSSSAASQAATLGSSAAGTAEVEAATEAETGESRPPLHGNGKGFRWHAPPGVHIVETTPTAAASTIPSSTFSATTIPASPATATSAATASASDVSGGSGSGSGDSSKSREDSVGTSDGIPAGAVPTPRASYQGYGTGAAPGEAKLRVCTPKGDGGASDLSLWVTLRNVEEEEEERDVKVAGGGARGPFLSLSPVTAGHLKDSIGCGRLSSSSAGSLDGAAARQSVTPDHSEGCITGGRLSSSSAGSLGGAAKRESVTAAHPKDSIAGGRLSSASAGSLGGAVTRESEGAVKSEEEGELMEGGDGSVGVLSSNEDVGTDIDESFSDTAPRLPASGVDADQDHTGGGKGPGAGNSTRIAVATVSAATGKTGPGEGPTSSVVDWCEVGPVPVDAGGIEGLWRSLLQAFCGLLNFCHPHQGIRS
eukprot:g12137.t1